VWRGRGRSAPHLVERQLGARGRIDEAELQTDERRVGEDVDVAEGAVEAVGRRVLGVVGRRVRDSQRHRGSVAAVVHLAAAPAEAAEPLKDERPPLVVVAVAVVVVV